MNVEEVSLFNDEFVSFISKLQTSINNIDTEIDALKEAFPVIAQRYNIGKFSMQLNLGEDSKEQMFCHLKNHVIYEKNAAQHKNSQKTDEEQTVAAGYENCENDIISGTFNSCRKTDTLDMKFYPENGIKWNKKEREELLFIMHNIAAACDRAHMSEVLVEGKYIDSMTSLNNANGFILQGNQLINLYSAKKYTAFYFNLRNFKYVNNVVTYQGGNTALMKYADNLLTFVEQDEVVGRLGGDNFAIIIKNERIDEFIKFISNVKISVENEGKEYQFTFGATMGGYHLDEAVQNMGQVMMAISSAYQVAKEVEHQPLIYCTREMLQKLIGSKEVLMSFSGALLNREFLVYYQPKVYTNDNQLIGAEALVRWKRGSTILPPGVFVPVLERNGDVCKLDYYVFDVVCQDMDRWRKEGKKLPIVSSNFSRKHLKNEHFVEDIQNIADRHNVDHSKLEIEITETTDVNEYNTLLNVANDIKRRGFSISIDDFGTGYSSLNMLKEIPVDVLKLDKSLIDKVAESSKDKIMLKHIVNLAKDLSIYTLAEGVENKKQLEYLKSIGCNMIQGYYFDKPLPVKDFEDRMQKGSYQEI